MIYSIPTYSPDQGWCYTEFNSRDEFRDFVKPLFKEPGQYHFDEVSRIAYEHSTRFMQKGLYCEFQEDTTNYIDYWDTEKEKCRQGVIIHNGKGDTWYFSRSYYHWLNFLQIYDKRPDVKKFMFPDFRDVQYHICLYEELAFLSGKNAVILKRRQVASSYLHIARIFNKYIFEEGFTAKIGASDKGFIEGQKGCWKYLNQYHNFSNSKTAWIRYNDPGRVYQWEQKIKHTKENTEGEKTDEVIGTQATIVGVTFDQDPVKGVGGAVDEFFYEEGGVAPTADISYGYLMEAMKEGTEISGFFAIAGSVGDLKQCGPLQRFMKSPVENDFYPVTSTLLDESGQEGISGLFIPVFWGLSGKEFNFIDEYGNSLVDEAKAYIDKKYAEEKKNKDPHIYQLLVSQGPRNIAEAFAIRNESVFSLRYTAAQVKRIEDGEYYVFHAEMERDDNGKVVEKKCDREPIPYDSSKSVLMKMQDKRGCVLIHEKPISGAPWMTYMGTIDPVERGATTTSESMACIYIWKNAIEVERTLSTGEKQIYLEGGKLVCEWVGRYDDVNDTNEMLSMIVEYYNAYTMCENNKPSWIQYMRFKKKQIYMAKGKDMVFDKEMELKQTVHEPYGINMTDGLWQKLLEYGIDFLSEKLGVRKSEDGMEKPIYGVERISYIWLLREMQAYNPNDKKANYDRLKTFCILIGFIKAQEAIKGTQRRVERSDEDIAKNKELYDKLKQGRSPFHNMGQSKQVQSKVRRNPFHNMH